MQSGRRSASRCDDGPDPVRLAWRLDRLGLLAGPLVERLGLPVTAVPGDPRNIKITTPADIPIAEALLDA